MSKTAKRFVIGTLVAGATGYVAGLLTAPKSGRETRKDIKQTAKKTSAEVEKKLKELHSQLEKALKRASEQTATVKKIGTARLNQTINAAETAKEKIRLALSSVHEGDSRSKDLEKAMREAHRAILHLERFLAGNSDPKKDQ